MNRKARKHKRTKRMLTAVPLLRSARPIDDAYDSSGCESRNCAVVRCKVRTLAVIAKASDSDANTTKQKYER